MIMMRKALATIVVVAAAAVMLAAQAPGPVGPSVPADVSAPPPDAEKTASGLISRVITPGASAEQPMPTDYVTVHYTGWTADGETVDSSWSRGAPPMFPLDRSLVGWRECVQLMTVGETRRCWVPQGLAYDGTAGRPTGTIVFDVELIDTRRAPTIPPPDVAAPPADAMLTASGLSYKILKPGTGVRRPVPSDRVIVHYTGWTTDGKMFDSSLTRGTPATLALTDVIAGWTEGMQIMVEGERTRFWIPEDLAYEGEAGSPMGMLVFEVDLIGIE